MRLPLPKIGYCSVCGMRLCIVQDDKAAVHWVGECGPSEPKCPDALQPVKQFEAEKKQRSK